MAQANPTKDPTWFDDCRFGLFVHYGLYSLLARHEWVMTREKTPVAEYERYAKFWEPDLFDAKDIAREAKGAGMEYAVLTTKHHEGFCLFDTKYTDYNSVKYQGRDLVAEWVEALRAEGLKVGLYFSLIDWHHPDYTVDFQHPRRDDADVAEQNESKNWDNYRQYMHNQLRELLTNYGKIDYIFFDFTYDETVNGLRGKGPQDWGAEEILKMCRELQPGMIVNDRLGIPGDVITPEQYQPTEPFMIDGEPTRWEVCQTMNGSWGYDRDNLDFKSIEMLVTMLCDTVAKGGNLILNVGPDSRGAITDRDRATLHALGEWMKLHKKAIVGANSSTIQAPPNTVITEVGDRAYIHIFSWPFGHLHLRDMADRVDFARLLNDGSEIKMTVTDPDKPALTTEPGGQPAGTLTLTLPVQPPDVVVPVIELNLKS